VTRVEVYVDPSCPWAWITTRWLKEVAPRRDLELGWCSFCIEIRDDYGVSPAIAPERRDAAMAAHALSHRALRVFEAARAEAGAAAAGDAVFDALLTAWGHRFFARGAVRDESILTGCVDTCGLDRALLRAADDDAWDAPITGAMTVAYTFGGEKTQTPTIVVRDDPPHGFKGPVMAPAPTGDAAVALWDALMVLSREPGVFEFTRPRANRPLPPPAG